MDYNLILNTILSQLPDDIKKQIELDMRVYKISNEKAGRLFFVGIHKMMESKNTEKNNEIINHFKQSLEIEDNPGAWSYYTLASIFSNNTKEEIYSISIKWLESCIKNNQNTTLATKYVERFK